MDSSINPIFPPFEAAYVTEGAKNVTWQIYYAIPDPPRFVFPVLEAGGGSISSDGGSQCPSITVFSLWGPPHPRRRSPDEGEAASAWDVFVTGRDHFTSWRIVCS